MSDEVLFTYPLPVANKKSRNSVQIRMCDSQCLDDRNFLNDNIISFYLLYVQREIIGPNTFDKVKVFDSFFYLKIKSFFSRKVSKQNDTDYSQIRKWFQKDDIFKKDFLVFPVCENVHWFLVIVCYPNHVTHKEVREEDEEDEIISNKRIPAILVLDSLGTKQIKNFTKPIRDFLFHEWRHKMMEDDQLPLKTFDHVALDEIWPSVPRQQNGYDCGIFILAYCHYFLRAPHRAYSLIKCENRKNTEFCDKINIILDGQVTRPRILQLILEKAKESERTMRCHQYI